jgi:hypothetical protein
MERTEFIDDDGKVYSLPVFEMMDPESLRQKKERQVFDAIVDSMVQLKETGLDRVPCFILGDLVFSMSRDSVVDNLDSCLEYYTSIKNMKYVRR